MHFTVIVDGMVKSLIFSYINHFVSLASRQKGKDGGLERKSRDSSRRRNQKSR